MEHAEIRVESRGSLRKVFINGVEQKNVMKVENEILHGEITTVKITYVASKYEVIESFNNKEEQ